MAGAAGHPDVSHAATSFGPLPGGRADAGLPADLGATGPQLMAERAELGLVFENRYWHGDDHAPAGGGPVPLRLIRSPQQRAWETDRMVSTRIDWVREHCQLLRAISAEFG